MDKQPPKPMTYRDSGVDIDAQDEALDRIKSMVRATRTAGVRSELGGFGGLFQPDLTGMEQPLLVSSCDGVGTKLKLAFETGIHNTVGKDLVNHCINDILVQGAKPLFFMDYVATGRLEPAVLAAVVEGIADGCREAGCALLGGETAEMPGFYADQEYDVAGFIVGLVERKRLIDGQQIQAGDVLLGLSSTGLHTNGYSLARKVLFEVGKLGVNERVDELEATVGEALLAPHRCYLNLLSPAIDSGQVLGLAHITGGGLTDNLPRILPEGCAAQIQRGAWAIPPIFTLIERLGHVEAHEMYRTFNMGIGMVVVVRPQHVDEITDQLTQRGEAPVRIGEVISGARDVRYAS